MNFAQKVKRILQEKSGVALITVLGIMTVIAILATGMFYFSTNELNFTQNDIKIEQSQYLARSAVEVACKAFPNVAGQFDAPTAEKPVTMTLYLHKSGDDIALNSESDGADGVANVTITSEKRGIKQADGTTLEHDAWIYAAKATIGNMSARAQGYSMPQAKAYSTGVQDINLGWLSSGGALEESNTQYKQLAAQNIGAFGGTSIYPFVPQSPYPGVVVVDKDNTPKITLSKNSAKSGVTNTLFAWAAPTVFVQPAVDLTGVNRIAGLKIKSDSIIFDKEIRIYANRLESKVGDLIIEPYSSSGQVYFRENVYLYIGNERTLLFPAGSSYTYTNEVDFFSYAIENGYVSMGISGWIKELLGGGKITTGTMTKKAVTEIPTVNSLSKVVWE